MTRAAALGGLFVLATGCSKPKLSDTDREQLEADLAMATRKAEQAAKAWRAAYADVANVSLEAARGPCPPIAAQQASADAMDPAQKAQLAQMQPGLAAAGMGRVSLATAAELATAEPPLVRSVRGSIERTRDAAANATGSPAELVNEGQRLAAPDLFDWDVIIVREAPLARGVDTAKGAFDAQTAQGVAYLFDYRQRRIACAGAYTAKNADRVEYAETSGAPLSGTTNAQLAVTNDLDARAIEAALASLQQLPPP